MTTCPRCQTVLDGVDEPLTDGGEQSETVRYVLCPDCNQLVAGSN